MNGTETAASQALRESLAQTFLRNMAALWHADPALAQQLDDLPDDALLDVTAAKSGLPTLAAQAPDGRIVWLHSRYDPCKQAEQLAQTIDLDKPCVVLTGMGLGYPVEAIWRRTQCRGLMVVLEPDLRLLLTALHCVDLAEPIKAGGLVFVTREEADHLHAQLDPHKLLLTAGTQIVTFEPGTRLAGDFHRRMSGRLSEYIAYCRMSLVTIVSNAAITARNVAYNLPAYLATPPIDVLKGRFAGVPGIVVAAGPSLRKHLAALRELQGRAVICCVQTVFKTLLTSGITPDFVTSLDYHEVSKRFFEGIEDFRGVHLVAEPKASHHVIDAYGGAVSLLNNEFARLCVGDDLAARGGLRAGATVAHLAFYLLEYAGCDPVIFIGQDLAFSDGLYYAPGVAVHEVWAAEQNRYHSLETMEWLRIARHRQILHAAQDIHGDAVYTDDQMLTYLQQFERDFAATNVRVIDATEGGLPKRGAERIPFAEAIERFCSRPIPAEALEYRRLVRWWDPSRLEEGRTRIVGRLERLERFLELCRQTLADIRDLQGLLDNPAEFNRRIARADQARVLVRRDTLIFRMVSELAQGAELRRLTADRLVQGGRDEPVERARRQLQRDQAYIQRQDPDAPQGLIEAGESLREILKETARRFEAAGGRPGREAG